MTQPVEALKLATQARIDRGRIRKHIIEDRVNLDLLFLEPPQALLNANVFYVLKSVKKMGRTKALMLINKCGCTEYTKIKDLTDRQRYKFVSELNKRNTEEAYHKRKRQNRYDRRIRARKKREG